MTRYQIQRNVLRSNLGNTVREARERLALSEQDLEHLANLPAGAVTAIEDGRESDLTGPDLQRLAATLGLRDDGTRR